MIAPNSDIWGSNIHEKSLCKLLQSKIYWKLSVPANWNFVNIASSERKPMWDLAPQFIAPRGILDYIHTDVWGPTKMASIGANHYFVSFIDDYSRRCWVYTMKHKGEVLELFVEWKKNMEKNTGKKIKALHSDNGGEYTSDHFLQLCHDEGIKRYFTVREIPQQNRVAERMNITLLEKVHCMLSNAGISKSFRLRHWRMLGISLTGCLCLQ